MLLLLNDLGVRVVSRAWCWLKIKNQVDEVS